MSREPADEWPPVIADAPTENLVYSTPQPLKDDAWRVGTARPDGIHYYGVADDYDGRPKCGKDLARAETRPAEGQDRLCSRCEGWYWINISMPWLA